MPGPFRPLTAHELSSWRAFERVVGPVDWRRADHHAALVAYMIALANHDPKKGTPRFDDFLLDFDQGAGRRVPEQSVEEMLSVVEQVNEALGGADRRVTKAGH